MTPTAAISHAHFGHRPRVFQPLATAPGAASRRCCVPVRTRGDAVSHDHNFKNLIVEYPRRALEFFAPGETPARDDEASCVPVRQEQLKERPGSRFRALDTPLLVEWADGRRDAVLFALEEESDWRRFSAHRLAHISTRWPPVTG